MMKIIVNGNEIEIVNNSSIIDALSKAGFSSDQNGIAIAINCEFIPRSLYQTTLLKDGDVVEVLSAMQGG